LKEILKKTHKKKKQGFESTVWQTTWSSFLPTANQNVSKKNLKAEPTKLVEENNENLIIDESLLKSTTTTVTPITNAPNSITIEDLNNIEVLDWSTTWNVVNNVVAQGLEDQKKKAININNKQVVATKAEQNLYKTELCRSFSERGVCRYGNKCQFAHGSHEQRSILRHPKYKTEVCKTWRISGNCRYGNRCRFVHPKEEWHTSWITNENPYEQPNDEQVGEDQVVDQLNTLNINEM